MDFLRQALLPPALPVATVVDEGPPDERASVIAACTDEEIDVLLGELRVAFRVVGKLTRGPFFTVSMDEIAGFLRLMDETDERPPLIDKPVCAFRKFLKHEATFYGLLIEILVAQNAKKCVTLNEGGSLAGLLGKDTTQNRTGTPQDKYVQSVDELRDLLLYTKTLYDIPCKCPWLIPCMARAIWLLRTGHKVEVLVKTEPMGDVTMGGLMAWSIRRRRKQYLPGRDE